MRAGLLRHLLIIDRPVDGLRDDVGQVTDGWEQYAEAWGQVETLTGTELTDARQVDGRATVSVTIRYQPGITPDMRVREGDQVRHILSVSDLEGRERMLVLTCSELV